jgi:hypothetical protein
MVSRLSDPLHTNSKSDSTKKRTSQRAGELELPQGMLLTLYYEISYDCTINFSPLALSLHILYLRREYQMTETTESLAALEILKLHTDIDLSLNDLRILVGCMRALAYQSELEGEQYLDVDAQALQKRLESLYEASLRNAGGNGRSH